MYIYVHMCLCVCACMCVCMKGNQWDAWWGWGWGSAYYSPTPLLQGAISRLPPPHTHTLQVTISLPPSNPHYLTTTRLPPPPLGILAYTLPPHVTTTRLPPPPQGNLAYTEYGSLLPMKIIAWLAGACVSCLIIASRKHYTVDIVIAWYTVPLVFYAMYRRWTTRR